MTMAIAEPVWTLGDRMWKARKTAGLEQTEVAKLVGVSRALVSRWERDQSDPGTRQLQKFAEITGAPLEWLLAYGYMPTGPDTASGYMPDGALLSLLPGAAHPSRRVRARTPLMHVVSDPPT